MFPYLWKFAFYVVNKYTWIYYRHIIKGRQWYDLKSLLRLENQYLSEIILHTWKYLKYRFFSNSIIPKSNGFRLNWWHTPHQLYHWRVIIFQLILNSKWICYMVDLRRNYVGLYYTGMVLMICYLRPLSRIGFIALPQVCRNNNLHRNNIFKSKQLVIVLWL